MSATHITENSLKNPAPTKAPIPRMTDAEFYAEVASILGAVDTYRPSLYPKRTRWNNRSAGNGRFEGHGIIRRFGDHVQVALRCPVALQRNYESTQEALDDLRNLIGGSYERLHAADRRSDKTQRAIHPSSAG